MVPLRRGRTGPAGRVASCAVQADPADPSDDPTSPPPDTRDVEARLDALQRESEARRAELRALAATVPAATSRRAYLAAMARGVVDAPDKPLVAKRVVLKALRTPAELWRRRRG